jgi:NTE family protein
MSGRAGRKPETPRGLAGPKAEKTISLALQGGGAHGAFTWGVLDYLLQDGRLAIEAVTGASAGSMNAVVLLEGWIRGGPDGAREQLRKFWKRVSLEGVLSPIQRTLFDQFLGFWSSGGTPAHLWLNAWSRAASPYEFNPLDINPLRAALKEIIDFERVRACTEAKVFIAATNVWTGKIHVFDGPDLTVDHVLASACLPRLFRAVEIDGEPFWDGGYLGNPALWPLYERGGPPDIVLVQLNPLVREETPTNASDIMNRLNEITFNGSLMAEMRAIDFVQRLLDAGRLEQLRYRRLFLHVIEDEERMRRFKLSTKFNGDWDFLKTLRGFGREAAERWLADHFDKLGKESSLDIRARYL